MNNDETLMEHEIEERDLYIKEANKQIRIISESFKIDIPLLTPANFSRGSLEDENSIFDINYSRRKTKCLNIANAVAETVLADVDKISVTSVQLKGGSLNIAFELLLHRFGFENQFYPNDYSDILSDLSFDLLDFSICDVAYRLARLYEKKYMRYRLWDDHAINALERYFFTGDVIHCPEIPYFAEHNYWDKLSFEEFIDFFDDAVRGEVFDRSNKEVISCSYSGSDGKMTYFAEYVPVLCFGLEKLKYYYDWRNEIIKSLESE